MKLLLTVLMLIFAMPVSAAELYTQDPQCAIIRNETAKNVLVAIRTDFYTKPDGARSYYEEVLRLKPGNMQQVCAKGPFYPDYKVSLTIKSFIPLFDCKTKLQGEIPVRDKPAASGSDARDIYAVCLD